jgi:predicted aconitase with swiveling domain
VVSTNIEVDGVALEPTALVVLVGGDAEGSTLVLDEPLSFWGGFEAETGVIIDQRHPQEGAVLSGKVLIMTSGRGSSSASSVIAEAIRLGTAPAAIIMRGPDEIVALGAIVADELYGLRMPVVVVEPATFEAARHSSKIRVTTTDT